MNINNILIHKYKHIIRNNIELMKSLLNNETFGFKNYILNEVRPDIEEDIWKADKYVDIDYLARMQFINMNQNVKLDKDNKIIENTEIDGEIDDDELNTNLINKYKSIDSEKILNEIKENIRKQIERHMFKDDVIIPDNTMDVSENTNITVTTIKEKSMPSVELASWEDYIDFHENN